MMQDLRYAFRVLRQNPGFAVTAILTLAVGIGATTAMFSVLDGILLKPLPYEGADRIVFISETAPRRGSQGPLQQIPIPPGNFRDYYPSRDSFEHLAAFSEAPVSLTIPGGMPARYDAIEASLEYLDVFQVRPLFGRGFRQEDTESAANPVVLLSHSLWASQLGGRPDIVGSRISIDGVPREVIGVLPPGFDHPEKNALWLPLILSGPDGSRRDLHTLRVMGRLQPGVTPAAAQAKLQSTLNRIAAAEPEFAKDKTVNVTPLIERVAGDTKSTLWLLAGAVAFVLAISYANVASLILARGAARQQELSVRAALGATRWRLVRQLLGENLALSLGGTAAGILLAAGLLRVLKILAPQNLPRLNDIAIDARAVGFTLAAAICTGVIFGLIPALRLSMTGPNTSLKEQVRGSSTRSRLRGLLVVSQVASAVVLMAGTGLLIRSLGELLKVDLGFRPEGLITMRVTPLAAEFDGQTEKQIQLGNEILRRIREVPRVTGTGFATSLPLEGNPRLVIQFEGFPPVTMATAPFADYSSVSAGYLEAMRTRLRRGRFLNEQDDRRSPPAVVVNQALARAYFPNQDALGKRLQIGLNQPPEWRTIVGIVEDVKSIDLDREAPVQVYGAFQQTPTFSRAAPTMDIVARTTGDPAAIAEPVRRAILAANSSQPVYRVQTMDNIVDAKTARRRFSLLLMGLFAAVALTLSIIGLAGVVSYLVTQRTREIGIRLALGAQPRDVVWLVQRHALLLVGIGVLTGLAGAALLSRLLGSMLYGVSPHDPLTYAAVTVILFLTALLTAYLPARRATKIDPAVSLKQE